MPNTKQSPASAGAKLETPGPARAGTHRDTPPPPSTQAEQAPRAEPVAAGSAGTTAEARVNRRGSLSRHPMAVELTALISAGHMDRARTSVRTRLAANAAALARSPRAGLGVLDLEESSEEHKQSPAQLILHTPKLARNQGTARRGLAPARSPLASSPAPRAGAPGFGGEAPQGRARVGMSMEAPPALRGGPGPELSGARPGAAGREAPGPSSTAAAVVRMASRASAAGEMLQLPAQQLRLGVTVLPNEVGLEPGSPGVPADAVLVKFIRTIDQPAQSLSPAQALAYIRLLQSRIGGLQATLIQREAELAWSRQEGRNLARQLQATQQRLAAMQQAELVQDALHDSRSSSSFSVSRAQGASAAAIKRRPSGSSAMPGDLLQSVARLLHLYLHGPVRCDSAVLQGALQLCGAHGASPQQRLPSPPSLVAHAVALQAALAAGSRAALAQVRQLRAWLRTANMRKLAAALSQPPAASSAAALPSRWQPLLQALSNDALTYTDTLLAKPGGVPTPRQAAVLRQAGSQLVPALAAPSNPVAVHEWAGLVCRVLQEAGARTPAAARPGGVPTPAAGKQSSRPTGGAAIASSQHMPAAAARGAALLENIAAQRVQLEVLQQAVVLLHVQLTALESAAQGPAAEE